MTKIFIFCFSVLGASLVYAGGFGDVAANALEPAGMLTDFINTACVVLGISFLFTSIIRYSQYRVNPLAHPLSTPVFFVIAGVILLCLPLSARLVNNAPPSSSFLVPPKPNPNDVFSSSGIQ